MEMRDCERNDDFVAWLYGEATEEEAQSFEQHLKQCVQCRNESASFRCVRNSVSVWRADMLGVHSVPIVDAAQVQKHSAIAAIREFFTLAPFWLKGAVTLAAITLLALVTITMTRPKDSAPIVIADNPTPDEIARMVEQQVQLRLRDLSDAQASSSSDGETDKLTVPRPNQRVHASRRRTANALNRDTSRRPLTKAEREQLAADLRLTLEPEELDLELLEDKLSPPEN